MGVEVAASNAGSGFLADSVPESKAQRAQVPWMDSMKDVEVRWRSTSGISFENKSDPAAAKEIHAQILATPVLDLIYATNTVLERATPTENGVQEAYRTVLHIASVSIQHVIVCKKKNIVIPDVLVEHPAEEGRLALQKNVLQLWIEDSEVLRVLHAIFDDPREDLASNKKLALDLGFVLCSHSLRFDDLSLGFVAPLTTAGLSVCLLTGKLLESFMITTPTHYPFMPAEYFAPVQWPPVVKDSCSGKVHSLCTFLMPAFAYQEEEADGVDEEVKYCNFDAVSHRQPWKHRFSTMQLYQLVGQLLATRRLHASHIKDCNTALALYKTILHRMKSVDPGLLHRDKNQTATYHVQSQCVVCDDAVASFFSRWNPLPGLFSKSTTSRDSCAASEVSTVPTSKSSLHRVFGGSPQAALDAKRSKGAASQDTEPSTASRSQPAPQSVYSRSKQRHHCRLCFETVCATCSPSRWLQDRICLPCQEVLEAMDLLAIPDKPERAMFALKRAGAADEAAHSAPMSDDSKVVQMLSGQEEDYDDWGSDRMERCCSELIPAGLREWRDCPETDYDEEDGVY